MGTYTDWEWRQMDIESGRRLDAEAKERAMNTKTEPPLVYFKEYPDIEFPEVLRDMGFVDNSWHNDASAQARLEDSTYHDCAIVVWCDHENPDQRELSGKRFTVMIEDGEGDLEELVDGATDNVSDLPDIVARAEDLLKARLEAEDDKREEPEVLDGSTAEDEERRD